MSSEIIEKQNPASETSDRSSGTAPTQRFLVVVMIAVFLVAGAAIAVALRLGERRSLAKDRAGRTALARRVTHGSAAG